VSARGRIATFAVAFVALIAIAGWVQDYRQIHRAHAPEPLEVQEAATFVRQTTKPGALVVSDLPIVPYLADRREPGALVDTSAVRFESRSLTARDVRETTAAVYVAGREFLRYPDTIRGLRVIRRFGGIEILKRP
jgi:hypothetical protein